MTAYTNSSAPSLEDILPCSPLQEGLLFHSVSFPDEPDVYVVQLMIALDGELDTERLRRALRVLMQRHSSLRAGYWIEDVNNPVQMISRDVPLRWTEVDLTELEGLAQHVGITQHLQGERRRFVLSDPPLMRFSLLRLGAEQHRLIITFHHILMDGWSLRIFMDDLWALYEEDGDPSRLLPITPYSEYFRWLALQDREAAASYWAAELAGIDKGTFLGPADGGRESGARDEVWRTLPLDLTGALATQAQRCGVTMNAMVQAAWGIVLARMTGRDDVVVGVTVAGRPMEVTGIESMVGLFINTLPLRMRCVPGRQIVDSLLELHDRQSQLIATQFMPLAELQKLGGIGRLFNTLLVFENYPVSTHSHGRQVKGLRIRTVSAHDQTHYPLSMAVGPGERLQFRVEYRPDLFERTAVETLVERLVRALEALARDPEGRLAQVDVLTVAERRHLLTTSRGPAQGIRWATLVDLFEEQTAMLPDRVAVVDEGHCVTYGSLKRNATRVTRRLAAQGIGPEQAVALATGRSVEMVVGLLGILQAGAVCVPVDDAYPLQRLNVMLSDATPSTTLGSNDIRAAIADPPVCSVMPTMSLRMHPEQAAYIIFTSGATGRPKGVVVSHRALVNKVHTFAEHIGTSQMSRYAFTSSIGFDPMLEQLFCGLCRGATVVIVPSEARDNARLFREHLERHAVSIIDLTPGLAEQLFLDGALAYRPSVLIIGSDVLPVSLANELHSRRVANCLLNVYGPTETCVDASAFEIAELVTASSVPIGHPLPNYETYVLDSGLALAPAEVPGELYISGKGLARGYHRLAGATAERFVANPYGAPGVRMYRTGDVVRRRLDGTLEFLGRTDDQVKLHGFRVELGDVEAALRACGGVAHAVVVLREDVPGKRGLVGYVTALEGHVVEVEGLRQQLNQQLPRYLIPSALVVLDRFPQTAHGKTDRRALPPPEVRHTPSLLSCTPEEEVLSGLFAEVLGLEHVNAPDDFFDLGGHSLTAMRLMSRVRAVLGAELTVEDLLDAPSPRELTRRLQRTRRPRPPLTSMTRPARAPLSFVQRRLWLVDQLRGSSPEYNLTDAFRLSGPLELWALEQAVTAIVERHEVLRTRFEEIDGEPTQVIEPARPVSIAVEDLRDFSVTAQGERVIEVARRQHEAPFDLSCGQLLRVQLLKLDDRAHVLLHTVHHILSDAWSVGIFNRELVALYAAYCNASDATLPPLPVQYADYAAWQRQWLDDAALEEGLSYWREQLAGVPARVELPTDRPRPLVGASEADVCQMTLSADETTALKRVAREHSATLYMTLLTAFGLLLSRYTGQDDIVCGSPVANRQELELEGLIGCFVNTLALRIRVRPDATLSAFLTDVRRTALDAYRHQDVPFEQIVSDLTPHRSLDAAPLVQVSFAFQNVDKSELRLPRLSVEPISVCTPHVHFDLSLSAVEADDQITIWWGYRRHVFARWRIEQMMQHFAQAVRAITTNAKQQLRNVDLLTAEERSQLLDIGDDKADNEGTAVIARTTA